MDLAEAGENGRFFLNLAGILVIYYISLLGWPKQSSKTEWLKQQKCIAHSLEASKIKVLTDLVSSEVSLLGLQMCPRGLSSMHTHPSCLSVHPCLFSQE